MANTYQLIASNTLSTTAASVTFSSIPGTYTDLVLRCSTRNDDSTNAGTLALRFNSDSGTNYSRRFVRGNGSTASSSSGSSEDLQRLGNTTAGGYTSNTFGSTEIYIPNYTVSANKPISSFDTTENNATASFIGAWAGLWRNTAAITSIVISDANSFNFVSGSSFFLYGIKNS